LELEILKIYVKDFLSLDHFIKDEKIMFYKTGRSKIVKQSSEQIWVSGWVNVKAIS
jgi:hypothetical protein